MYTVVYETAPVVKQAVYILTGFQQEPLDGRIPVAAGLKKRESYDFGLKSASHKGVITVAPVAWPVSI